MHLCSSFCHNDAADTGVCGLYPIHGRFKKGERHDGNKNAASAAWKHRPRVAVNSGLACDVRISSYVWRPYFFHDDSTGRLTESRTLVPCQIIIVQRALYSARSGGVDAVLVSTCNLVSLHRPNRPTTSYVNFPVVRISAPAPWKTFARQFQDQLIWPVSDRRCTSYDKYHGGFRQLNTRLKKFTNSAYVYFTWHRLLGYITWYNIM